MDTHYVRGIMFDRVENKTDVSPALMNLKSSSEWLSMSLIK